MGNSGAAFLLAAMLAALATLPACRSSGRESGEEQGAAGSEACAVCGETEGCECEPVMEEGLGEQMEPESGAREPVPAAGDVAAGGPAADAISTSDAAQAARLLARYGRWMQMHEEPFVSEQHGGYEVMTYASALAQPGYRTGRGPFPAHASLALQGWKDGELKVVWLMQKRMPGYDPARGDWWYAAVRPDGAVENAGKVAACIACHGQADNDRVFGGGE